MRCSGDMSLAGGGSGARVRPVLIGFGSSDSLSDPSYAAER